MTITEFKKFTENRLVYLDGATGSNLMKRGMPAGVCPEKWILDHPDILDCRENLWRPGVISSMHPLLRQTASS